MFVYNASVIPTGCEPGVTRRVLAYNDKTMMCEIRFEKGAKGNMHTHPHTQVTYIVKGSFAFTVDGETKVVNQGDTVLMPSGSMAASAWRKVSSATCSPPCGRISSSKASGKEGLYAGVR